jgi:hypothetical protein
MFNEYDTAPLDEICAKSLDANLSIWGWGAGDALSKMSEQLTKKASGIGADLPVAFTYIAVNFFAGVAYQLASDAHVFSAFKGNSDYLDQLKRRAEIFFGKHKDFKYSDKEYLVDFYACTGESKLNPLVTMESEAISESPDFIFHDLDKLLSVSSPRRIYFGKVPASRLEGARSAISEKLDAAYRSQILLRGDQVEIILLVTDGPAPGFKQFSFDAHSRMKFAKTTAIPRTASVT